MEQIWILETTFGTQLEAQSVARTLVQEHLAFCVQMSGPMMSFYTWEGKLCEEQEYRLRVKFLQRQKSAVVSMLQSLHPYQTPQILIFKVDEVESVYYEWANLSTCK